MISKGKFKKLRPVLNGDAELTIYNIYTVQATNDITLPAKSALSPEEGQTFRKFEMFAPQGDTGPQFQINYLFSFSLSAHSYLDVECLI